MLVTAAGPARHLQRPAGVRRGSNATSPCKARAWEGSVEKTRLKFHANDGVNLYRQKVDGVLIGQGSAR